MSSSWELKKCNDATIGERVLMMDSVERRWIPAMILFVLCWGACCLLFAEEPQPFSGYRELKKAIGDVHDPESADRFWGRVVAHRCMPIIFDAHAVFLWRGKAESVEWRGDFSAWEATPETKGERIDKTDLWIYERTFPLDARLDYKIVANGEDWQLDPLNPNQQMGGYGPNSEVRMPEWHFPAHVVRDPEIPRGTFSGDIPIQSHRLGYTVNYRVYTPAGFNPQKNVELPVLYVTDGSDYWRDEMGATVIALDNLIGQGEISPILAVFMDPWDRKQNVNRREEQYLPRGDRSCPFCEFLTEELVPAIDAAYPTVKSRQGRAIIGASYGGLFATLVALRHGSMFGMFAMQSPAYWPHQWVLDQVSTMKPLPERVFISAGTFEKYIPDNARRLRDDLQAQHVNLLYAEVHDGHSWGNWRALLDDALRFFFPPPARRD